MLKRWQALLAALMLLPCLTLAEGGALMVSTRWEADAAALQTLLVRLETDEESACQLSEIGAELMQRLTTHILLQPNGAQATIRLREREIVSGSFVCEDGGVYLRCSVIPGIALFVPDVNMNPLGLTGEELEQLGLETRFYRGDARKRLHQEIEIMRGVAKRRPLDIFSGYLLSLTLLWVRKTGNNFRRDDF